VTRDSGRKGPALEEVKREEDLFDRFADKYKRAKTKESRKLVATQFLQQMGVGIPEDPTVRARAEKALVVFGVQDDKSKLVLQAIKTKAFVDTAVRTGDTTQAFQAAVESSPELKKQYEQYVKTWEQEQFKEVFGVKTVATEVPGAGTPDMPQIFEAERAIENSGVRVQFGNGNEGRIFLGDLSRDAAIVTVEGKTKLVVYDKNADRGFVGPIEPSQAKETMRGIAIDAYFTKKFQEFSTMDSEKDPAKMKDAKLLDAVHKFLPNGGEGNSDKLSTDEKAIIENLVKLLVKTDKEIVLTEDKVRFLLEYVAVDPQRLAKAKKLLSTKRGDEDKGLSLADL
jgi:hypothetical protein